MLVIITLLSLEHEKKGELCRASRFQSFRWKEAQGMLCFVLVEFRALSSSPYTIDFLAVEWNTKIEVLQEKLHTCPILALSRKWKSF